MTKYHLLEAKIGRGGFSGERTFEIGLHEGVAHVGYVRDANGHPLTESQPASAAEINGYVICKFLKKDGHAVNIELPDGCRSIWVSDDLLIPISRFDHNNTTQSYFLQVRNFKRKHEPQEVPCTD